jgi:predicted ATP-grasp superfamily ATP-dependent carboligase
MAREIGSRPAPVAGSWRRARVLTDSPTPSPARRRSARTTTDALVIDGSTRQALIVTRALGRSGLQVAAAESPDVCDPRFRVPTFTSRWAAWNTALPSFYSDPTAFARSVLDLSRDRATRVVIPSSDGSIAALRPWRSCFEGHGVALALASEAALEVANDKQRTLDAAAELGVLFPRTAPIAHPDDTREALAEVGYPAVIKPTQSWVRQGDTAARVVSRAVTDEFEAMAYVQGLNDLGSSAVAQQWVGGSREAVSLVYAQGRIWAEFAQVAYRMAPVLGGVSVVRESIAMPRELRTAAVALVEALQLEGCSEVEFRRDASGRPLLMEINARLSGSIEVAVRSGVDFPTLLWRWAAGEPLAPVKGYQTGVRMRYLNGDLEWLWENLKSRGQPDSVPPWQAVATFAGEFLRPQAYDYVDRSDLRPAWVAFVRDVGDARRRFAKGFPRGADPLRTSLEPIGA